MKNILFFIYASPSSPIEEQIMSVVYRYPKISHSFECVFFDLSEDIGYYELIRRVIEVARSASFDKYYLVHSAETGITFRDYLVKNVLCRLNLSLVIHHPPHAKRTWINLFLRRFYFFNQKVIVTNREDYSMVKQYTSAENIVLCPEVDGKEFTQEMFVDKLYTALA